MSGENPKEALSRPESSGNTTLQSAEQVSNATGDLEKLLGLVVEKLDQSDLPLRSLGVSFENLCVQGIGSESSYQTTLGDLFNPLKIVEAIRDARHPMKRDIIIGFDGVIRPGEMLLVLGRPGAGCSTFLKTLANQTAEYHSVNGEVHYDAFTPQEIYEHYRGDVLYSPEDDTHFATLTVKQTVQFAARVRAPSTAGRLGLSRNEYADLLTTHLLRLFGLTHTRNTLVGDAAIRGVSGGEKKRVSICEVSAARARLVSWDNTTRGLDSSTALEYVRALRTATDVLKMTTITALYQAGESLYNYFDKVAVVYEGRLAYFGPASSARQYFIDLGYEPANRQTTADFLVAVTDPNGRIPRSPSSVIPIEEHIPPAPRTAAEFAAYFQNSRFAELNRNEIEAYKKEFVNSEPSKIRGVYQQSAQIEHVRMSRKESPYLVSLSLQAKEVMMRRLQMARGNWLATLLNVVSYIFQGIVVGTAYNNTAENTGAFFSRGGVLFFSLLFSALATMSEIPALFGQRPIVLRQSRWGFYHPFVDQLALFLVDLPIFALTILVFAVIIYELVQLQQTAGQFFIFALFLFSVGFAMKGLFRSVAAACRTESVAQVVAGVAITATTMYGGYQITRPTMVGALKWIYHINPFYYSFEALMINEFHTLNGTCTTLIPRGAGYENVSLANQVCNTVGSIPGQPAVDGNNFIEKSFLYVSTTGRVWRNFGIIVAFVVGLVGACLIFTEININSITIANAVVLYRRPSGRSKRKGPSPPTLDVETSLEKGAITVEKVPDVEAKHTPASLAQMELATTDVFSWQNISYTVPIFGIQDETERRLLYSVSGYVQPGKLTALMGESGAGKTTLVNVLAQRADTGVVTGDKFVNGQALPRDFQAQTGYCQQTDTHLGDQTVKEALLFSAKLRQPPSVPLAEKEVYAEKCLMMCGLDKYRNATVGSLNVENRKRTTIAVELAAKPKLLLFVDEPTSGLDSQSAWAIMAFLRDMANSGQAILCTIHQPSAELFQVFDRLLLLRKGGETVYLGDVGHNATTMISYFERNGSRRCAPDENPAEFMLDVIGAGATAHSDIDWHLVWTSSPEYTVLQTDLDRIHREGRGKSVVEEGLHTEFATPWLYQTMQLLKRDMLSHWRNPTYILAKYILSIFSGLFIGFSYYKSDYSQQGTQNKLFSVFTVTIISVPLVNQLQVIFINMRSIYEIRERPSRMYSWTALLTSQFLVELPWNIGAMVLLFFCWYWTVGYLSSRAAYTWLMLCILFPLYYTSIGQAVAAMSPNAEIAAIVFTFLFSFIITFNGIVQPFRQLGWWKWMYRVSPYTYLIEGSIGQALGLQAITCSDIELVTLSPPSGQTCQQYMNCYIQDNGGYITNPDATTNCNICPYSTTDQYLQSQFNIFYSHRWRNVGLIIIYIVFNIAAIFACTWWFRIRTKTIAELLRRRK
ncbi:hypothetical protein D9758_014292 [Tetrapyrgos nigripes]|uniref:ABC transporter domain-containing protein n=1 Tax=Tetrapyrgos nigripes TaxID=182062 RepID=A0A8H5FFF6_9AGAR|nr:hypothetical protein D9758_014292 [Tetrapyrgos nigripes]